MSTYEQDIEDLNESLPSRWRSYPKYKDSGIEWLGEIPSHWECIVLKLLAGNSHTVVQTGPFGAQLHSSDYVDEGVPLILIRNIGDNFIDDGDIPKITVEDAKRLENYRLEIGDIVFSRVGSIGRLALVTEREEGWIISGQCLRLRINNSRLNDRYLVRALGSEPVLTYIELKSVGSTRESINTDILRNMPIPLPLIEEQAAIAAFLDRETAEIDALIAKKEALIDLLQEQRSAIISHAVTKGLNPDAPMKDSGIEWLGEIPEHWEVTKVKWHFRTTSGGTPNTGEQSLYYDGTIPWIRTTDLTNARMKTYEIGITERAMKDTACTIVPRNSVLVAMYGGAGTIGKNGLLTFEATVNQAVCAIQPSANFSPEYTWRFMQMKRPYWMIDADGSRKDPNIGQNVINESYILYPPIAEQYEIASFIDNETNKLDSLVSKTQETIEKLQEYRTALISAAVTGKIDVREEYKISNF